MKMRTDDPAIVPLAPGEHPRKWQTEAMLAVREHLPKQPPELPAVLVSAATGTGKGTLIASMTVKAARTGRRCLFLVHRDELIDDVMARAIKIEPALYAGKVKGSINEVDRHCVFASVQTLKGKRLDTLPTFDFVFTDEAHHAVAKSYRSIYKKVATDNPRWRHILFTATPWRNAGAGKTAGLGEVVRFLAYEYPLKQAIDDGALCPIRGVTVETELDLTGVDPDDEGEVVKLIDTEARNAAAAEKYLEHARRRDGTLRPAIAFTVTVDHARNLAAAMVEAGIRAEGVWGTDKERKRKIEDFKSGRIDVLCNNNLLSEGFDHPATEIVMLLRPTQSRGLYAQQVGRATRNSPRTGKTEGLILDFVANSATHSLASLVDLTMPEEPGPRIEAGAEVRHRRIAVLSKGLVEEVRGYEGRDNQGEARVLWKGDPSEVDLEPMTERQIATRDEWLASDPDLYLHDRWWRCSDLLMVAAPKKGPPEPVQVPMGVGVLGMNEFSITLFGEPQGRSRRVGWYTYPLSPFCGHKRKVLIAKSEVRDQCAILHMCIQDEETPPTWEAWLRTGETLEKLRAGTFEECEASVAPRMRPMDYRADWIARPATQPQLAALTKWRAKVPPNVCMGEAGLILDVKITEAMIRDYKAGRR